MERNNFDDCFNWLEKFHGKRGTITAEAREGYFKAFADEHDEVFIEGVNISTEKLAPGQFPTIDRLRKFVTDARERLHEQQKKTEPKKPLSQPIFAPDYRNLERGRTWLSGIIAISEGKLSSTELIEKMGQGNCGV